tara:strand:- start:1927 stop:3243 length:1317 start_codon:yes stop_codon:yes gene_type:complete
LKAIKYLLSIVFTIFSSSSIFSFEAGGHVDPVPPILLGLVVLFSGASFGGFLANKLKQPVVLGELVVGVFLGNLVFLGYDGFDFIKTGEVFQILAGIGVILLLFEVGLESSLSEMIKVGFVASVVAIIGVVFPFFLGLGVSYFFMPEKSIYIHAFVGATLCATSVGITARVLKDLGKINIKEAKIILGAAVIDDVLGLIILAVVSGIISSISTGGAELTLTDIFLVFLKAVGFLVGALIIGTKISPSFFRFGAKLQLEGVLLSLSLIFCFVLSYLAHLVGLAPIVGAFAAGLMLDGVRFPKMYGDDRHLGALIFPVSKFFVPVFFVHMGMQVEVHSLLNLDVLAFGLCLSFVAILGKQACGLGILGKNTRGVSRALVGIGMIPRGEVGLIFAMIGAGLSLHGQSVVDEKLYSAIVMMVMITTMITPPFLIWALERKKV